MEVGRSRSDSREMLQREMFDSVGRLSGLRVYNATDGELTSESAVKLVTRFSEAIVSLWGTLNGWKMRLIASDSRFSSSVTAPMNSAQSSM